MTIVKRNSGPDSSDLVSRIRALARPTGGGAPPTSALLLDISSSMDAYIGAGVRAIDELRKLANEFNDVRRFQFGSTCSEIPANAPISDPFGGTALHAAFDHVKRHGVNHVVLITDGQPDSEQYALRNSVGLKIDVFYVGPDPAPDFLAQLAQHTGGKYGRASLESLKELGQAVRGLLPGPKVIAL